MASLEFSREEVENLARKLDSVQAQLSDGERILLLAIFAAAGEQVDVVVRPTDTQHTAEDLRKEIVKAFIPGDDHIYMLPCRVGYIKKPTPNPDPNPNPPDPKPAEERPADPSSSDAPPAPR